MAHDKRELAAGVILSGTGTDGTKGSVAIRGHGGFVIAQTLESAQYSGMPSSVKRSGQTNAVLAPSDMIPALQAHFHSQRKARAAASTLVAADSDPLALRKILALLKTQTTHDFSQYKPSSINRRIERRMAFHKLEALATYLTLLEKDPHEVGELFNDILIGVTSFFRDPEVFSVLQLSALASLIERRPRGSKLRVWSAGCSTGEEAYSLAIVFRELLDSMDREAPVEIFATDIDQRAIATARSGLYSATATDGMAVERVQKFFVPGPDAHTVKVSKAIRNVVIFSEHDVLKDPPFLKLDVLSCRNLLIYFSLELQRRLLPLFHYALNPGGILVLGTSETIGEFSHLFQALDRDGKIYVRRETAPEPASLRHSPFAMPSLHEKLAQVRVPAKEVPQTPVGLTLQELTEQTILNAMDLAAVLVDEQGEVFYLHGKTGTFLEPAPGLASSQNLLKMAKEGLKHPLATALHHARVRNEVARSREVQVSWKDQVTAVQLTVHPLKSTLPDSAQPLFLVILEERHPRKPSVGQESSDDERLQVVKEALKTQEEYLRATTAQMERSNEELRSSNEELQSVNEELSSVNAELTSKVTLLTTTLNDMNNLLAATGIATVFVDLHLNILRFTPEATKIINLVPADVGRPVAHLTSNLLNYQTLERDTQAVLDSLVRFEAEIQTRHNEWYRLRIQPYRTLDNVIEGAVISFGDINEIVRQRQALQANNDLLRLVSVIQDSQDPIIVQDLDGKILAWNPTAVRQYGWTEAEALSMNFRMHVPEAFQAQDLKKIRELVQLDVLEPYQAQRLTKDGRTLEVSVTSSALLTQEGRAYAISTTERAKRTSVIT